jgi:hypothetical protein
MLFALVTAMAPGLCAVALPGRVPTVSASPCEDGRLSTGNFNGSGQKAADTVNEHTKADQ